MKRLYTLLMILALTCSAEAVAQCGPGGCPAPQAQPAWRSSRPQSAPGTSRRIAATPPGYCIKMDRGTGTLIYKDAEKGAVLTAYHVVEGCPREGFQLMFPSGEVLTAHAISESDNKPVVRDVSADLVLLITDTAPRAEPCPLAATKPKPGDKLTMCGYGGPGRRYGQTAAVAAEYDTTGDTLRMTAGEAQPGDSGGPILNSDGALVAVVSGSTWDQPHLPDATVGGHVEEVQQLCQTAQFWAPWNARTEQQRIRADADVAMEKIRAGSQPISPGSSGPDPSTLSRLGQLEQRVGVLETVAEAAKKAAANAETEAGKAFAEAVGAKEGVAEAVKQETDGLIEKVAPGIFNKVTSRLGWLFGPPGIGIAVVIALFLLRSGGKRVAEGGKSRVEAFTDMTPWTWDDAAGRLWSRGLGWGYERFHPNAVPPQPPPQPPPVYPQQPPPVPPQAPLGT